SGHFLILWALALHEESLDEHRLKSVELSVLAALTLLVNSYLFVIVVVLIGSTVLDSLRRGSVTRRSTQTVALGLIACVAIALCAGYAVMFTDPRSMKSGGFGFFSWNPMSLIAAPAQYWTSIHGIVRDATGGQYEGESYVGLGALFLIGSLLIGGAPTLLRAARNRPALTVALILFACWAASSEVYFGSLHLAAVPLSPKLIELGNYCRATGRFIWPVVYILILAPIAIMPRIYPARVVAGLLIVAAALQVSEAQVIVKDLRRVTADSPPDRIDETTFIPHMRGRRRVWQYPSWPCGSLQGVQPVWGGVEANRELQLELLAARLGVPSNSVYTSRASKDCAREAAWAGNPVIEPGVSYLLSPAIVAGSPMLSEFVRHESCDR